MEAVRALKGERKRKECQNKLSKMCVPKFTILFNNCEAKAMFLTIFLFVRISSPFEPLDWGLTCMRGL